MSMDVLKLIADSMKALGLRYAFGGYTKKPVAYPYFVGEYQETENLTEDGLQESTFMLTGFSRGKWLELEEAKEKIAAYFGQISGKTVITDSGSGVAVFYASSLIVPTGDAELKRIQINLSIKEWKVN